ncbi:hypothetical protein [Roseobacter sp.]|uniref:hypothetical protein n=1 Tax=Roseobacter sp. TaxID=1907202 RepID=UPI00385F0101
MYSFSKAMTALSIGLLISACQSTTETASGVYDTPAQPAEEPMPDTVSADGSYDLPGSFTKVDQVTTECMKSTDGMTGVPIAMNAGRKKDTIKITIPRGSRPAPAVERAFIDCSMSKLS